MKPQAKDEEPHTHKQTLCVPEVIIPGFIDLLFRSAEKDFPHFKRLQMQDLNTYSRYTTQKNTKVSRYYGSISVHV